ncbi:MAG: iron ABC transporter permease [Oscillospiraceae bacterium]|nr:iron ABC transporter permease [Oscillospiraceae bacterium]
MERQTKRCVCAFVLLFLLLLALFAANLLSGSVKVSPPELLQVLRARGAVESSARVVWTLRLPRLLAAAFLGGALAVSGFLLQTFFANPIAGPFVLGISSGAKLCVALTLIAALSHGRTLGSAALITAAFCGSMLAMGLILLLSARVKKMSLLVVCGVMIGYICSAITEFVVTFADDANIVNLHNWSMGSFSGIRWANVWVIVWVCLAGLVLSFLLSKPMGAWQLGEVYAQNLGVDLRRFRLELILLSSLLSACVTAFAGPISFVGVAAPHLMKSLFKTAKPIVMIPACFLGGAVFCLFCDLLARTLFQPTELSISAVTAVFGAPVVIWMLLQRKAGVHE